jgi:hypothetical protein
MVPDFVYLGLRRHQVLESFPVERIFAAAKFLRLARAHTCSHLPRTRDPVSDLVGHSGSRIFIAKAVSTSCSGNAPMIG